MEAELTAMTCPGLQCHNAIGQCSKGCYWGVSGGMTVRVSGTWLPGAATAHSLRRIAYCQSEGLPWEAVSTPSQDRLWWWIRLDPRLPAGDWI